MAYSVALTIPPNTPIKTPVKLGVNLLPCIMDEVSITFPSGCAGLVGVKFIFEGSQVFPFNLDGHFVGNDQVISVHPKYIFISSPNVLTVLGYNLDDTFPHTIHVILDVTIKGSPLDPTIETSIIVGQPDVLPGVG